MSETLKPCPFCGGGASLKEERPGGTMSSGMETPEPWVECNNGCVKTDRVRCDGSPWGQKNGYLTLKQARAKAIETWNTRTPSAAEQTMRKALELIDGLADGVWRLYDAKVIASHALRSVATPEAGEIAGTYVDPSVDPATRIRNAALEECFSAMDAELERLADTGDTMFDVKLVKAALKTKETSHDENV